MPAKGAVAEAWPRLSTSAGSTHGRAHTAYLVSKRSNGKRQWAAGRNGSALRDAGHARRGTGRGLHAGDSRPATQEFKAVARKAADAARTPASASSPTASKARGAKRRPDGANRAIH
eukprot:1483076-Alexandrium_andersonii.AAC.2